MHLAVLSLVAALALPPSPFVMGPAQATPWARAQFLTAMNPALDAGTALNYALLYEEEAAAEGVNPDLAFAQMLLETSYLRFGGQVGPGQNNFAGLGALDGGDRGLMFVSPRIGVRAQIQHLKYYATTLPLNGSPVNPRLGLVRRGSAPTVWQLAQAWASDPDYGSKVLALTAKMLNHARRVPEGPPGPTLRPVAAPAVPRD